MANIKSAIKRVEIAERNRLRNKAYKTSIKNLMKKCLAAAADYQASPSAEQDEAVQQQLAVAYSKIDKAVKKGVLHANTGARKKARLARAVKREPVSAAS